MAAKKPKKVTPETNSDSNKEARREALKKALQTIEKNFGKGAIMTLGDSAQMKIDSISTGSFGLDQAIGIGGLPKGRIIEIYGPESSGKTTLALHCVAESQKKGGTAAFVDAEHALDPVYAEALGVDTDSLLISQPDTGEQALEIVDTLVRSGGVDIIIVDSVAALVPRVEIEGEMGDTFIGLQARLMSQALRKLAGNIKKSNTIIVFINQLRHKINSMGYGPNETTTGGRALKFYASVRLDVRKIETLKQGNEMIGSRTRVKVAKNKVAPPFKQCEFDIMYGKGISRFGEILDMAVENKIVSKAGSWFSYNGENLAQGKENTKTFLEENPKICEKIEEELKEALKKHIQSSDDDENDMDIDETETETEDLIEIEDEE